MTKTKCKYCGGSFKTSSKEYTLRSRHLDKAETTIENLIVKECKICGHSEMPEDSERYIEVIRQKIRKEMETQRNAAKVVVFEDTPDVENPLKNIKDFFRKLIG